jgi:hypothetical protein
MRIINLLKSILKGACKLFNYSLEVIVICGVLEKLRLEERVIFGVME